MTKTTVSLTDPFQREITYLRLSVTDRCDFRCRYCMAEDMIFLPKQQILSLEESADIAQAFVELGVKKIRLTGGEPLVRKNVIWLAERLGKMHSLEELAITTNGSQLTRFAGQLAKAGVNSLNVSLDTLDPSEFNYLTRKGDLNKVLKGIATAITVGFRRLKINAVILKGLNDHQILPLVDFALNHELDISFIEEMPLGVITDHNRKLSFVSSDEIKEVIETKYQLNQVSHEKSKSGPSRYWAANGFSSRIGFISPHSNNFCGDCNRVRVTNEGRLLLCLGHENSIDLRAILRSPIIEKTKRIEALKEAIVKGMQHKPERHYFSHDEEPQILRFMNMTGG